jgi:hypothetical protein
MQQVWTKTTAEAHGEAADMADMAEGAGEGPKHSRSILLVLQSGREQKYEKMGLPWAAVGGCWPFVLDAPGSSTTATTTTITTVGRGFLPSSSR